MSDGTKPEGKAALLKLLEKSRRQKEFNFRLHNFFRTTTKILKIIAAVATGVAALFTAWTKQLVPGVMTAIGGVLSILIETVSKEVHFEHMRTHYYRYEMEIRHLCESVRLAEDLKPDEIQKFLSQYHRVEKNETRDRPSFQASNSISLSR